jgi:hypothetical protein
MQPQDRKTGWWQGILYGAGVLALLVLLTPGWAGAVDLTVDNGDTFYVPPSITYDNETIGDTSQGTLLQFSGSNTVNRRLTLGEQATGSGTYLLTGGSLAVGRDESIGNDGTGSFLQTGGSHTVTISSLYLGRDYTGTGTYLLTGGSLAVGGNESIGFLNSGTNAFTQTGGKHTVRFLVVGNGRPASGTYLLTGGSLEVGGEYIGGFGTGVFDQSSGQHTVAGTLSLAGRPGSSGTYNLKFGTLAVNGDEIIGDEGTGVFNQSWGKNTVAGNLILAANPGTSGTYNLQGGSLSAPAIQINSGGTFNVLNPVTTVTGDVVNDGTVKTTNAIVTWNGSFTNNGAYISDPSTQTFNDDLEVGTDGYLVATHSQDLFIVKGDFISTSTQNTLWNTNHAGLQFTQGGAENDTMHDFYITGVDNGPPGDVTIDTIVDNFAWRLLNITNQDINLVDGNDQDDGALYVGVLMGAEVSGIAVNNIISDSTSLLNIYYDPDLALNFYLGGLTYDLAGGNGQLIPFHTPLPPSVLLLGSGLLGLGLLGWRRKRSG